jgi:hypothetical protein
MTAAAKRAQRTHEARQDWPGCEPVSAAQHTPGLRIHLAQYRCGGRGTPWLRTAKSTNSPGDVTCLRCLAAIAKAAGAAS